MSKRALLRGIALACLCPALAWTAPAQKSVNTSGSWESRGLSFYQSGKPLAFRAVEWSGLRNLPPATLKNFLKQAKAAGVQAFVTEAFTLTAGEQPALVENGGKLNPSELTKLDDLVAAARAENIGLILGLSAGVSPLGGQAQWSAWVGSANPGVFFRDFQVRAWFQGALKSLLTRVNPKTKTTYGAEGAIWGWVLADGPLNPGGDPAGFTNWVADTAAQIKTLSPSQRCALAFAPGETPGLSAEKASGAPGVDFLLMRLPKESQGAEAAELARKTGLPVAAVYTSPPGSPLDKSIAGAVIRLEGALDESKFSSLRQALTALGAAPPGVQDVFTKVECVPGPAPELKDLGTVRVSVTLRSSARLALRWGQGGEMGNRLEGPSAAAHTFQLTRLTADKDLTMQVEAAQPDGTLALSERKSLRVPAVKPVTFKTPPSSQRFITAKNGRFYDGDKPWRYLGTNIYYLHYSEEPLEDYIFSSCRSLGMKVVRLWAFGEAPNADPKTWKDWETRRYFTLAPGVYYEKNLKTMDRILASAKKNGIRLILALANNWTDFGGAPQWAAYFGSKEKNDFFDKPEIQKAWRDYVAMLVNRTNTLTGVKYKDDPTIMSWDLMNEPRYERDNTSKFLGKWVAENAAYIRSLGVKQMISTGSEGFRASQGTHYAGADFIELNKQPGIDFATYHIYPAGEYTRWNLATTEAVEVAYVKDAHEILKKPIVMEEFGLPKTDPKYDKPLFIRAMLQAFYAAGGDGVNYWMIVDPAYRWGDGNEFDPTMTELANIFAVTGREIEEGK